MITIVLPISRRDYLKPVFDCLKHLLKPHDTELLIITDGDRELEEAVDRRLDSISFSAVQVVHFGDSPAEDLASRRYRIAAIHNKAKDLLSEYCTHVFVIEDDTVYPADALDKLSKTFAKRPDCGFVQGVEMGRWKTKYIGGWTADDIENPRVITSVMPSKGIQKIDAGGLYCALIDSTLYAIHDFQPYDTNGKNGLGCDVNLGLSIRQLQYQCYMDWSILCDHIGDKGSVNLGNTQPVQVVFEKGRKLWNSRVV